MVATKDTILIGDINDFNNLYEVLEKACTGENLQQTSEILHLILKRLFTSGFLWR